MSLSGKVIETLMTCSSGSRGTGFRPAPARLPPWLFSAKGYLQLVDKARPQDKPVFAKPAQISGKLIVLTVKLDHQLSIDLCDNSASVWRTRDDYLGARCDGLHCFGLS